MSGSLLATGLLGETRSPRVRLHVLLTSWQTEPLAIVALVVVVAFAAAYVLAARRLSARRRRWPLRRTAAFLGGLAVIVIAVNSGLAAYDDSVFKMHVVQHMLLMSLAPPLLALGAPVTLLLQVSNRRTKTAVLRVLHSLPVRVVSNPGVAFAIGMGTMYVYFLTPVYRLSVTHPLFHDYTHLHFLVAGCLFWWPVVSADPLPARLGFGARLGMLLLAIPFTSFLGIAIMNMSHPIAAVHTLADTQAGGAWLWGLNELFTVLGLAVVFPQWMHAEERQAAREDRRLDARAAAPATPAGARRSHADRRLEALTAAYGGALPPTLERLPAPGPPAAPGRQGKPDRNGTPARPARPEAGAAPIEP